MKKIEIPISVGELIDKITILEIKSNISDNKYVHEELKNLVQIKNTINELNPIYEQELKSVNQKLWQIEDEIRLLEKNKTFDEKFIELSRNIYKLNDIRYEIKKKINLETNSKYQEIKFYPDYLK